MFVNVCKRQLSLDFSCLIPWVAIPNTGARVCCWFLLLSTCLIQAVYFKLAHLTWFLCSKLVPDFKFTLVLQK